jgi:hypothetical protein
MFCRTRYSRCFVIHVRDMSFVGGAFLLESTYDHIG